jgi:CubicO group peptidase (beta-lactamase class C family)
MLRSYPQAVPMSQPAYSNIAFTILSSAIERVTGRNFTRLVEDVVARPLKLTNTFTSPGDDAEAVIPPGESSWGSEYGVNAP